MVPLPGPDAAGWHIVDALSAVIRFYHYLSDCSLCLRLRTRLAGVILVLVLGTRMGIRLKLVQLTQYDSSLCPGHILTWGKRSGIVYPGHNARSIYQPHTGLKGMGNGGKIRDFALRPQGAVRTKLQVFHCLRQDKRHLLAIQGGRHFVV